MKKINIICAAIFLAAAAYLGVYMVQDKAAGQRQKPSIEIAEELVEVSVADGEEALLKGVTASDAEDGDLTDKVIVETVSRFTPDQHRVVTYAVVWYTPTMLPSGFPWISRSLLKRTIPTWRAQSMRGTALTGISPAVSE